MIRLAAAGAVICVIKISSAWVGEIRSPAFFFVTRFARAMRSAFQRDDLGRGRLVDLQHGSAGDRIGVVSNEPRIGPLDHRNAGIVLSGDYAHRHGPEQRALNAGMPQRVERHHIGIEPGPFDTNSPAELDLSDFGAVIFASGFRPDYVSWVHIPGAFDDNGFPIHHECESTVAPGLYFIGAHFLRKRKSSLLLGVGEDAAIVAAHIAALNR